MADKPPVCPVDGCSLGMDVETAPSASYGTFGGGRHRKPDHVYYTCKVHGSQKKPR